MAATGVAAIAVSRLPRRRPHRRWRWPHAADIAAYRRDIDVHHVAVAARQPRSHTRAIRKKAVSGYGAPTSVLLIPAGTGHEALGLVGGLLTTSNWIGGAIHPDLTAADHIAVLRHWEDQYGAEVYHTGRAELALIVNRPPQAELEVARCAIEQYAYCYDLGDVVDVARDQAPTDHWYFRWD
jgi:hypothetical protein